MGGKGGTMYNSMGGVGRNNRIPSHHMHKSQHQHDQIIMDIDENLSDKEIYPPSHMTIPQIGKLDKHTLGIIGRP